MPPETSECVAADTLIMDWPSDPREDEELLSSKSYSHGGLRHGGHRKWPSAFNIL